MLPSELGPPYQRTSRIVLSKILWIFVFVKIKVCYDLFIRPNKNDELHQAALGCARLHQVALGCARLHQAALGCARLHEIGVTGNREVIKPM